MGVRDKIMDGLGSLADRISVDDHELSDVQPQALDREVKARKAFVAKSPGKSAMENPRSKYAGADAESAAKRRAMASRRENKIHAARDKRDRVRQKAQEDAFRRMKEQAARSDFSRDSRVPPRGSSTGSGSSRRRPRGGGLGSFGKSNEVRKAYRTLDLQDGVEFAEVKSAYRKLMRKYHPDRHGQSPKKQKAATELTMQVTQAYNVLERHLTGK